MFEKKSIRFATLVLLLVAPLVSFWTCVWLFAPNAPWWDDFPALLQYLSYPMPDRFFHLADFHNEHRLVLPRLVFELFDLIGGKGGFPFFWCTAFGDCLLLVYVFLFGKQFVGRIGIWPFLPFLWLFLDLANCENTIWTLTAVQSHSVFLSSFAAFILFSRRESRLMFVFAMACAVLASLSSASGLGVWPALLVASLIDGRGRSSAWLVMFVAAAVVVPYLIGFSAAHGHHAEGMRVTVAGAFDFMLCFMGNLCPVVWVTRLLGLFSAGAAVVLLFNFRRLAAEPVFAFFIYLLSIVASGMILRGGMENIGVCSRFEIVAISLFCCEAYLLGCLAHGDERRWHRFSSTVKFVLPCVVMVHLAMPFVASDMLFGRKAKIEEGYAIWPERRDALVHWDAQEGDRILQAYFERKRTTR